MLARNGTGVTRLKVNYDIGLRVSVSVFTGKRSGLGAPRAL